MSNCNCGASNEGRWASVHASECASLRSTVGPSQDGGRQTASGGGEQAEKASKLAALQFNLSCPFCGGPGMNVACEYVTCGAAWNPDCPGHQVKAPIDIDDCHLSTSWNARSEIAPMTWYSGAPPKPWSAEWFIAETTYGDRVVLQALPEDWTYDFKTADQTYFRADKIKRWMQFPDSQFVAPDVCECCGRNLINGDCASCTKDEAEGREFAARTGLLMP